MGHSEGVAIYIHVDDMVHTCQKAVVNDRMENEINNVSYNCSMEEMLRGIATGAGVRPPRIRLP